MSRACTPGPGPLYLPLCSAHLGGGRGGRKGANECMKIQSRACACVYTYTYRHIYIHGKCPYTNRRPRKKHCPPLTHTYLPSPPSLSPLTHMQTLPSYLSGIPSSPDRPFLQNGHALIGNRPYLALSLLFLSLLMLPPFRPTHLPRLAAAPPFPTYTPA